MQRTCHLCFCQQTQFLITFGKSLEGPCLPVCIYCVPPWVNSQKENWWYEMMLRGSNQRKPTTVEVEALLSQRQCIPITKHDIDEAVQLKALTNNYRAKFHIDELLTFFNAEKQCYMFDT